MKKLLVSLIAVGCLQFILSSYAQVPGLINYQGRIVDNGTNFDGTGQFEFALISGDGTTNYWSNDGTAAGQPALAVSLTVTKGLYSVLLGDTTISNMTVAVPATVFANSNVLLRVWFNDGVTGFQQLSPDQRIAAVGYALMAANVPDGSITSNKIAAGAVGSSALAVGLMTAADISNNFVTASQGLTASNLAASAASTNFVAAIVAGATNQLLTAVPLRDNQYAAWQSLLGRLPVIPPGITVAHANNTSTAWGNDLVDAWASLLPFDYIVLNNPTNALINGYPCLLTTNMVMNFPAIQNVRAYVLNTTWWNVQDSNTSASWSVYFSSATNCALYGYPPFRGLTLVQEESTAFPTNDMAYPVYAGHSETNVYMCGVNAFDLRDAAPASDKVLVAVGTTGTNSCNFTVEDSAFGFGGATAVYPLCTNCMTVCPVAFHGSDPGADYVHNCIFYGQIGNNSFDPSYASPATLDNCYLYMPAIENGNGWTDPDAHRLGSIDTAENSNMFPAIVAPLVHIPTNYCADAQAPNFIPNSNAVANGQTNPVVLGGSLSASSLTATGNATIGGSETVSNTLTVIGGINAASQLISGGSTIGGTSIVGYVINQHGLVGQTASPWPNTYIAAGFQSAWNSTYTNNSASYSTNWLAYYQQLWKGPGTSVNALWLGQASNQPAVFYLYKGASPSGTNTSTAYYAPYVSTNSGASWMTNAASGYGVCSDCGSISDAGSGTFNEYIPGPVSLPLGATILQFPGHTNHVWLIDTSGLNPNPTNSLYLNGGAGTLSVSDVTGPN
jgi:hypothetical protein